MRPFFNFSECNGELLLLKSVDTKLLLTAPLKAIELFNLAFEKRQINNIKVAHRIDESFIKFIVGGYDSLTLKNEEHHRYKHQLLIRFDEILRDYKLRRSTDRILEKLI